MHVQRPEAAAEALVVLAAESLVAEDQHMVGVEGRLDLGELRVAERLRQVDALDLRADHRIERPDVDRSRLQPRFDDFQLAPGAGGHRRAFLLPVRKSALPARRVNPLARLPFFKRLLVRRMADDQRANPSAQVDEKLDDDEPIPLQPDLPPEIASPLAPFAGAKPPAPAWFEWALAQEPERRLVPVDGANIELLTWGEVGKPGPDLRARQQRPRRLVELHRPVPRRRVPGGGDLAFRHGRLATGARPTPSRPSPPRSGSAPRRPVSTRRR